MDTERIMLRLEDLRPNPFKKHIESGTLDKEKLARIEESIEETGFWDGLACRKNGHGYELAFGHHRLVAAINKLGKDYKTSILIGDYDDADMVRMMCLENSASEGASVPEQIDAVTVAKKFLKANPKVCKMNHPVHREQGGGKPHEHGSEPCITAFLGEHNWSRSKVHRLLQDAGLEDKSILENRTEAGPHRRKPGQVGHTTAAKLGALDKPMQKAFVEAIKKTKVVLPARVIEEAIEVASEAVGEDASESEQKRAAVAAVKAAEEKQTKDEQLRKSKDINDILQRITNDLMGCDLPFDEDDLAQAIGLREYAKASTIRGTVSALRRVAARLESYAEKLEAPPQKKLTSGKEK